MKVVECAGTPKQIGRATGEALREEIRHNVDILSPPAKDWPGRLPLFLDVMRSALPDVLEELEAIAEGANLPAEDIYLLNFPQYADELRVREGCTNIAFRSGPNGPVWGKNNDGQHGDYSKRLWPCARIVRPAHGIPLVVFPFAGMLISDGMNGEGVATGHSSVGSRFQQSDTHVPIRPWMYKALLEAKTTADYVAKMISVPLRGKGYSIVCVDRHGAMRSLEAPCPIVQVRASHQPGGMNCVNCYQLPPLQEADRRPERGKANALARQAFLEKAIDEAETLDLDYMVSLLRHHGDPSICRHGNGDGSHTEYSTIGLPAEGRVLYVDGYACESDYLELSI